MAITPHNNYRSYDHYGFFIMIGIIAYTIAMARLTVYITDNLFDNSRFNGENAKYRTPDSDGSLGVMIVLLGLTFFLIVLISWIYERFSKCFSKKK